jgi:hypothetical protein
VSVSKIVEAQPILVSDGQRISPNIPLINREDFEQMKCCEDLMAKL